MAYFRGENHPGGWFFLPVEGEPHKSLYVWIINTEFGVSAHCLKLGITYEIRFLFLKPVFIKQIWYNCSCYFKDMTLWCNIVDVL